MCENRTVSEVSTSAELGRRVREARLALEKSQDEVASELSLSRTAVTRIESGDRQVSSLELVSLSRVLDVPLTYFVEDRPAEVTSLRQSLTDDAGKVDRSAFRTDVRLDYWVRAAELLLGQGLLEVQDVPSLGPIKSKKQAETAAGKARKHLGLRGPVPSIQDACERFGLYIFLEPIKTDGASRSPQPGFGVAIVSSDGEPGRRRMTAAHELGHHILGDAYSAEVGGSRDEREQWITAFAAEFLLPEREFKQRWSEWLRASEGDVWEGLLRASSEYRVSWSSAVMRASSADVLGAQTSIRELMHRQPTRADMLRVIGDDVREDLKRSRYGRRWTRAVMEAAATSLITRARAEELLIGSSPFSDEFSLPEQAP